MNKFKNYISNNWVEPNSNLYFKNLSPANVNDVIGEFPQSNSIDVGKAAEVAKSAFKMWKNIPAPKRGDILRVAGDIFSRRKKELARIMTR